MIRVYRYGLLPPTDGQPHVADQLARAHAYATTLAAIERERREREQRILAAADPVLAELTARLGILADELAQLDTRIKARRAGRRGWTRQSPDEREVHARLRTLRDTLRQARRPAAASPSPDDAARLGQLREAIRAAQAQLATLRAARRARGRPTPEDSADLTRLRELLRQRRALFAEIRQRRTATRRQPSVEAALATLAAESKARRIQARHDSGLYWGTYLLIEQFDEARRTARQIRPPSWRDTGLLGVEGRKAPVPDVLAGRHTRLTTTPPEAVPGRRGKPLPRLRLRVGSEDPRGLRPIWAAWPVILHRPLPPEGRIARAAVHRTTVAGRPRWHCTITVDEPDPAPSPQSAAVAVDLRWRLVNGSIQAAQWAATDQAHPQSLTVPHRCEQRLRKCEDLRSIRDQRRNALRARLAEWAGHLDRAAAPELAQQLDGVAAWHRSGWFGRLWRWWRDHRVAGDTEGWALLDEWRARDHHLWRWEANNRRKALEHRTHHYRTWAAALARRYGVLVIEDLPLTRLARQAPVGSAEYGSPGGRAQRVDAAPGALRQILVHAFQRRGGRVWVTPPRPSAAEILAAWRAGEGHPLPPPGRHPGRWQRRATRTVT